MLQNKLLERQLKNTIIDLKYNDLTNLLKQFQNFAEFYQPPIFKKKGLKCAQCTLILDKFSQTGYGRSEQQAFANAVKSLFDIIISQHYKIEQVKQSLKCLHRSPKRMDEETLDLSVNDFLCDIPSINNLSVIQKKEQNMGDRKKKQECNCIYVMLHEQQKTKINNLQARLKLMSQQNSILKQLLLKDFPNGKDKQNRNYSNLGYRGLQNINK